MFQYLKYPPNILLIFFDGWFEVPPNLSPPYPQSHFIECCHPHIHLKGRPYDRHFAVSRTVAKYDPALWPRRCRRGASVTPWPLMTGVVWWVKLWCQNWKGQDSQGHVPEGLYEHIEYHVRYWTMNVEFWWILTFLLVFFANYNVSQKTFLLVVYHHSILFRTCSNYSAFHVHLPPEPTAALHTSITSSTPTRIQPHSSSAMWGQHLTAIGLLHLSM